MITVAQARERARQRYERHHVAWALDATVAPEDGAPEDGVPEPRVCEPIFNVPLRPPTERAALADPGAAVDWAAAWRAAELPGVVWEARRWASLGTQQVPTRLTSTDPAQVAAIAGRTTHWRTASGRVTALLDTWAPRTVGRGGELRSAVRRHAAALIALTDEDFHRLQAVLSWLVGHPDSGAYIRQLPVRGVDTKWTKNHRGVVTALHGAITGAPDLGLATMPDLVRVRFLDPSLAPVGLRDVSAPVPELDALDISPDVVLVVENLETLVALPELPGVVVVLGAGHALNRLSGIGWLAAAHQLLYWGDLDSHGFAILDRFRSHFPGVTSVLMDRATLQRHLDLCVAEPRPTRATLTRLTTEEAAALEMVRAHGDLRLEQERIDLTSAVGRLERAIAGS